MIFWWSKSSFMGYN